jgi:predicted phage tail protein
LIPKVIKLVAALVLFAICMGFRSDVSERWLRVSLATIGFALIAWGILQMLSKKR